MASPSRLVKGLKRSREESRSLDDDPHRKASKQSSFSGLGSLLSEGSLKTLVILYALPLLDFFLASYGVQISGDSYSESLDDQSHHESSNESEMTWVDHLRTHPDIQDGTILNFSFPGATAEVDLGTQISRFFRGCPPKKTPASEPTLDPSSTYYIFFLGINDCGMSTEDDEPDAVLEKILDAAHTLYIKAGARTFVFFDVPPTDRSPVGMCNVPLLEVLKDPRWHRGYALIALEVKDAIRARVDAWNTQLRAQVSEFAQETPRATVLIFSVHAVITDVLDNPEDNGFAEDDAAREGGAIWADFLHLTTAVHKILADRILDPPPSLSVWEHILPASASCSSPE